MSLRRRSHRLLPLALLATPMLAAACHGSTSPSPAPTPRPVVGQSSFTSAPPAGGGGAARGGADAGAAAPSAAAPSTNAGAVGRAVEETDLYRLEGTHLYYLNAYRGLMVFDVSDVDHPKLLGRSAIYGSPVEMLVRNGIATVVVADWYGTMDDGSPFHGSIVRGLDATDPKNIKVLGEARLGGWVQDTRVVGDVLYAVSEDYGWSYGFAEPGVVGAGVGGGATGPNVVVSSVSFAGGKIAQVGKKTYAGYDGVFNVTSDAILFAHSSGQGYDDAPAKSVLEYLDISDPGGNIASRGSIEVDGFIQGWGADNGRWNVDFADGKTAHAIGCVSSYCGGGAGYVIATADFTNPDAPKLLSELDVPGTGWGAAARFDGTRLYLSPDGSWSSVATTPLRVYDLSAPTAPKLAGETSIPGSVWMMIPSGNQLFALGQDDGVSSSSVSLKYLDVTNAAAPTLLGTSAFGDGWAWTPAASTFKAFTKDATKGLVVLPFSGWSYQTGKYNNGVQLIEFTPTSLSTGGAAKTHGWVERGIFVGNRIVSLSDLALSVVDYSDPHAPKVTAEVTLARNVVAAQPAGATIAEVSSDWWGNDTTSSEVRALPVGDAGEDADESAAPSASVDGVDARVFSNGNLAYVVTTVDVPGVCPGGVAAPNCTVPQQQVQIVDVSNGTVQLRGKVALPVDSYGYGGWGWSGYYWYDWYDGADVVQVGSDVLAFRRWHPYYDPSAGFVDASSDLYVVDLSNPDAPAIASTVITNDLKAWWGNMQVIGSSLYVSHYDWIDAVSPSGQVRYFVDRIDLTDRAHPVVGAKINVPGLLVGGSATDPSVLYTIDYRWYDATTAHDDFDVVKVDHDVAYLQSSTALTGWVGNVFVRGDTAYASAQTYDSATSTSHVELHQIDVTNPSAPIDRAATAAAGWGWLLDVQGDRAIVSSGWGDQGVDIYRLSAGAAPTFDQFVRTRGWWVNSVSRQDNRLFLSSGYWGVQAVDL